MGLLISRLRRKKSTTEILERLESKIKSIERNGEDTERKHKKIVGYVMAFSIGLYVLFAILYYYKYMNVNQHFLHKLLYATPLLVVPVIVILLRSCISWYYNWSLEANRSKLVTLLKEKKKILEEVKNTETYKVATEILEKFGSPEPVRRPFRPTINVPGNAPSTPTPSYPTPGQLRQRQLGQSTPISPLTDKTLTMAVSPLTPIRNGPRLSSVHLPRPVLNNSRTGLEKLIDFIVKDGPNYRMALVCKECSSHNGMAMIEEFDYITYVCAYCGTHNPARKARPIAPPLQPLPQITNHDYDSPSPSSDSDSETEIKAIKNKSGSEDEADRSPSPRGMESKSADEKKQD